MYVAEYAPSASLPTLCVITRNSKPALHNRGGERGRVKGEGTRRFGKKSRRRGPGDVSCRLYVYGVNGVNGVNGVYGVYGEWGGGVPWAK